MGDIFVTSATSIALISIAAWLSRAWVVARLTADIRLENDSKLEELRAELQKTSLILSNLTAAGDKAYSQSQVALLPNKIKAIEEVWGSVLAWNEMTAASMFVAILPIEWIRKNGVDPKTKKNFETLLNAPNHLPFMKDRNKTEAYRPFLTERAWALYSAFNGFYISRITKASMLTISTVDHAEIWERIDERDLVSTIAPQEVIEKYDSDVLGGSNDFIKYLKDEMIKEFKLELTGERDSKNALSNAAVIQEAAERLLQSAAERPEVPTN